MRFSMLALALSTSATGLAPAAQAQVADDLSRPVAVKIAPGALPSALRALSRAIAMPVVARPDALRGKRAKPVRGTMPIAQALKTMLEGTDLTYRVSAGTILIIAAPVRPTPPAQIADDQTGDIVVTGSIAQNQDEIAKRRAATGIVDTLTQDDTGNLADQSIAEALRRIPGVTTIFDEDEGQFVTVRGTRPALNYISVDGLGLASVGNNGSGTRQVDLSLIPSQVAQKTEVYKTFTADLDAGAVGGVVNIVPRSAYNMRRRQLLILDTYLNYFTFGAVPGINSLDGEKKSRIGGGFNATFAQRFGDQDQFGIVLAANYQRKQRDQTKPNSPNRTYYTAAGKVTTPEADDFADIAIPGRFTLQNYTNRIINKGLFGRLEYRPSDRLYLSLIGYGYRQGESETRNTFDLRNFDQPQNLTPAGGSFRVRSAQVGFLYNTYDRQNSGAILHSGWKPDERTSVDVRLGYSGSGFDNYKPEAIYAYAPNSRLTIDTSSFTPTFTLPNPETFLDPRNYTVNTVDTAWLSSFARQYEAKLDVHHNDGPGDLGLGAAAGIDWRGLRMRRDNRFTWWSNDRSTLEANVIRPDFQPYGWPYQVLWIDYRAFEAGSLTRLAVDQKRSADQSLIQDYHYDEDTTSTYAQIVYATPRLRLIAGGRFDRVSSTSHVPASTNGTIAFSDLRASYDNFLPSASMVFNAGLNLRLKAAYSRTIGRPNPNDVASPIVRTDADLTITRGNPAIRPRVSDNFDIGVEQFFAGRSGLLAVSLFDKEVRDEIFDLATPTVLDGNTYLVTQPQNADRSWLRGIEVLLVKNGLPVPVIGRDLGVSLNGIRTWGEIRYRVGSDVVKQDLLPVQMKWAANAAIFYNLPRNGEVRFAANYQGEYVDALGNRPYQNEGWKALLNFDLTARYNVTERFIVKVQARNITDANRIALIGNPLRYRSNELESGRSFYLNLIYRH